MFRRVRLSSSVWRCASQKFNSALFVHCPSAPRGFATSAALLARGAGHRPPPGTGSSGGWGSWSEPQQQQQQQWGSQGNVMPNSFLQQFQSSSGGGSTMDSLTPQVRLHLTRVYSLLGMGVGLAAVGSAAMILTPLGRIIPYWIPLIGGMVPLFWLLWAPPATLNGRLALFFAFTGFEGMALAPIVLATFAKGVLFTALVLTGAVFGGFTAAALLAPRARLIAFQGPLFGMLIGMVAVSFLNLFWPTAIAHSLILYGGLALFSALVAVDTQAMIERARCGYGDVVTDALSMFLNVLNIFVRIAEILRNME